MVDVNKFSCEIYTSFLIGSLNNYFIWGANEITISNSCPLFQCLARYFNFLPFLLRKNCLAIDQWNSCNSDWYAIKVERGRWLIWGSCKIHANCFLLSAKFISNIAKTEHFHILSSNQSFIWQMLKVIGRLGKVWFC